MFGPQLLGGSLGGGFGQPQWGSAGGFPSTFGGGFNQGGFSQMGGGFGLPFSGFNQGTFGGGIGGMPRETTKTTWNQMNNEGENTQLPFEQKR
ncbi:unnamed protein product [Didymodactylos carnosus]|uniref:Uncharacterized protein n=1 Tax=Didymodactylos carnosus TaxID=1234261 RepID=A0A8S2HH59_9BILA|nr:unnamed protein product [Didymodactylos carnosus]CAF3641938.1 unnamed protein product [Didymodactylos carnosus]